MKDNYFLAKLKDYSNDYLDLVYLVNAAIEQLPMKASDDFNEVPYPHVKSTALTLNADLTNFLDHPTIYFVDDLVKLVKGACGIAAVDARIPFELPDHFYPSYFYKEQMQEVYHECGYKVVTAEDQSLVSKCSDITLSAVAHYCGLMKMFNDCARDLGCQACFYQQGWAVSVDKDAAKKFYITFKAYINSYQRYLRESQKVLDISFKIWKKYTKDSSIVLQNLLTLLTLGYYNTVALISQATLISEANDIKMSLPVVAGVPASLQPSLMNLVIFDKTLVVKMLMIGEQTDEKDC